MSASLVLIIPTMGRKGHVDKLLSHLENQKRLPDEVILSAPGPEHVPEIRGFPFPVSRVLGSKGLTAQRNAALDRVLGRFDIVTFLDDDFIPSSNYLDGVVKAFKAHPDWAVLMGHVVKDGAVTKGITWEDGLRILRDAEASPPREARAVDHLGAYGCNMSMRADLIGDLRFDERLVLYGWQEDVDFTSQLRRKGRVVWLNTICGVHLGAKAGRVSGRRFGYSQIANPIYLVRKGTIPPAFAVRLMSRNLIANLVRSAWPESYVDRRGRLQGNMLALAHILRGKVEPEHVLNI